MAASADDSGDDPAVFKDYPGPHRLHRRQRVAGAERLQRARRHLPPPEPPRQELRQLRQRLRVRRDRRAGRRGADRRPRARQRADGKGASATTAITCSRRTTRTSPMRRCPRIRRGSTASIASSRCSSPDTSIAAGASASCRSTWTCTTRTTTAAAHATSTRTDPTGRSSASSRTTTRRSA